MSDEIIKDSRMCAKNARVALDTGVTLLDGDGSPTRDLNRGYTATRALGELRSALTHTRKAEELLALLEEGGPHP